MFNYKYHLMIYFTLLSLIISAYFSYHAGFVTKFKFNN
jgi:uncharacterized protein YfaT (DUF1175 family)